MWFFEIDGCDFGVGSVIVGIVRFWYGGGVVCDYVGDVVFGGSEIVVVYCYYWYGYFSGCVVDIC